MFSNICGDYNISPWNIKKMEAGLSLQEAEGGKIIKSFLGKFLLCTFLTSTSGWHKRNFCFYHLPPFIFRVPREFSHELFSSAWWIEPPLFSSPSDLNHSSLLFCQCLLWQNDAMSGTNALRAASVTSVDAALSFLGPKIPMTFTTLHLKCRRPLYLVSSYF